jgi:formylglycine-generating enzyme required for sulfatase activity
MKTNKSKALLGMLFAIMPLTGCNSSSSANNTNSPENPALEALKYATVENLVFVKGGSFMMGDVGYTDEKGQFRNFTNDANVFPVHQVTLSNYSIQANEVTFNDYDLYTNETGGETILEEFRGVVYTQPTYPADGMTWYQARNYCQWLGQQIGYPMDLPTEAQWEYAARSRGKAVAHATNNGDIEYGVNYRDPVKEHNPMPVGSWPPNPLGLYDMTGNVDEWTLDLWRAYGDHPQTDPKFTEIDPMKSEQRVTRGSGVVGGKGQIQLYRRAVRKPDQTGAGIGIRCVVNHPEPIKQR